MTNIERLALDLCRMKHCDKIIQALPLLLSTIERPAANLTDKEEPTC